MEKIDGIKIIQLSGLDGAMGSGVGGKTTVNGSLADQVVNGALKYRAQAPLLDSLLKEVGITGGDINGLTKTLKSEVTGCDSAPKSEEDNEPQADER